MQHVSKLSTIRPSEHQQNDNKTTSDRPHQVLTIKKYSQQIPVIPILCREVRYCMDPQESIQTKTTVNPSEEPTSKPINITSVSEYKHAKRNLAQHTIQMSCTKESKHTGESSQEDLMKYNKKVHPLEPKSR